MKFSKIFFSLTLTFNLLSQDKNRDDAALVTQVAVGAGVFLGAAATIVRDWFKPVALPNFERQYLLWQRKLNNFNHMIDQAENHLVEVDLLLSKKFRYLDLPSSKRLDQIKALDDYKFLLDLCCQLDLPNLNDFLVHQRFLIQNLSKVSSESNLLIQKVANVLQKKDEFKLSSKVTKKQRDLLENKDNEHYFLDNFGSIVTKSNEIKSRLVFNDDFFAVHYPALFLISYYQILQDKYKDLLSARKSLVSKDFFYNELPKFAQTRFVQSNSFIFDLVQEVDDDVQNLSYLKTCLNLNYSFIEEVDKHILFLDQIKNYLVQNDNFIAHKDIFQREEAWKEKNELEKRRVEALSKYPQELEQENKNLKTQLRRLLKKRKKISS